MMQAEIYMHCITFKKRLYITTRTSRKSKHLVNIDYTNIN